MVNPPRAIQCSKRAAGEPVPAGAVAQCQTCHGAKKDELGDLTSTETSTKAVTDASLCVCCSWVDKAATGEGSRRYEHERRHYGTLGGFGVRKGVGTGPGQLVDKSYEQL
ncbi:hypothetical protein GN244_ATG03905 [Phytophthora infestans]|uniref:Uncharacterized protein n=1 Tax=Phytophthora infestans TaxID=4787 RepID=A0A833WJB7_PHYIN|nr:hypothetical protein GN244_ATG03905 [Phytophthora infestans]KAF4150114.1 hypothetical protein GN958_ATG00740 [Phytophthora infestans]